MKKLTLFCLFLVGVSLLFSCSKEGDFNSSNSIVQGELINNARVPVSIKEFVQNEYPSATIVNYVGFALKGKEYGKATLSNNLILTLPVKNPALFRSDDDDDSGSDDDDDDSGSDDDDDDDSGSDDDDDDSGSDDDDDDSDPCDGTSSDDDDDDSGSDDDDDDSGSDDDDDDSGSDDDDDDSGSDDDDDDSGSDDDDDDSGSDDDDDDSGSDDDDDDSGSDDDDDDSDFAKGGSDDDDDDSGSDDDDDDSGSDDDDDDSGSDDDDDDSGSDDDDDDSGSDDDDDDSGSDDDDDDSNPCPPVPDVCVAPNDLTISLLTDYSSVAVDWTALDNVTNYTVFYGVAGENSPLSMTTTTPMILIEGLKPCITYEVYIEAACSTGHSPQGTVFTFTTLPSDATSGC